jgi:hypothetical protein
MKLFTAAVLAISLAAVGAANADAPAPTAKKPMMHKPMAHHMMAHKPMMMHPRMMHHWAVCGEGAVKASCVCKGTTAHAICKAGQWCHSFAGVCTM